MAWISIVSGKNKLEHELLISQHLKYALSMKTDRYRLGELLINFLDIDFNDFEKAKEDLIDRYKKGEIEYSKFLLDANKLLSNCFRSSKANSWKIEKSIKLLPGHPYFEVAASVLKQDVDALNYLKNLDYTKSKNAILNTLKICFDTEHFPSLREFNSSERFLLGKLAKKIQLPVNINKFRSGYSLDNISRYRQTLFAEQEAPNSWLRKKNRSSQNATKTLCNNYDQLEIEFDIPTNSLDNARKLLDDLPFSLSSGYQCETVIEMATLEMMKMIEIGVLVRFCKCCGRPFLEKGNYETQYCDRIAPNSKRKCSEIGPSRIHSKSVKEDPIKKAYQAQYMVMYKRTERKTMDFQDFKKWRNAATLLRGKADSGEIDPTVAIKWFRRRGVYPWPEEEIYNGGNH